MFDRGDLNDCEALSLSDCSNDQGQADGLKAVVIFDQSIGFKTMLECTCPRSAARLSAEQSASHARAPWIHHSSLLCRVTPVAGSAGGRACGYGIPCMLGALDQRRQANSRGVLGTACAKQTSNGSQSTLQHV